MMRNEVIITIAIGIIPSLAAGRRVDPCRPREDHLYVSALARGRQSSAMIVTSGIAALRKACRRITTRRGRLRRAVNVVEMDRLQYEARKAQYQATRWRRASPRAGLVPDAVQIMSQPLRFSPIALTPPEKAAGLL